MSAPIVVGVDGSESALRAVTAAAREARSRGVGLRVVHAFIWPAFHVHLGASPMGPPDGGLRNHANRLVAEAAEHARAAEPELEVELAVVDGEALSVLEAESRTAPLVVVGSRGMGGFVGLLVGSTAVHLAAHGRCPVLVVRGRPEPTGPVLVGVDGSPEGAAAVEFAFETASRRRAELVAQHVWSPWAGGPYLDADTPVEALVSDVETIRGEEERVLAAALAGWEAKYPDVAVRRTMVQGGPRPKLRDASEQAQLLVVGARGRGGFGGLLLGSVSQAMLHHAHCPVAVVRSELR